MTAQALQPPAKEYFEVIRRLEDIFSSHDEANHGITNSVEADREKM